MGDAEEDGEIIREEEIAAVLELPTDMSDGNCPHLCDCEVLLPVGLLRGRFRHSCHTELQR